MKKETAEYKYNILSLMNKLPHEEYKIVKQNLHKICNVGQSTFESYLYIKKGNKREIPGNVLLIIAKYFKINSEELFNSEIPTYTTQDLYEFSKNKNYEKDKKNTKKN